MATKNKRQFARTHEGAKGRAFGPEQQLRSAMTDMNGRKHLLMPELIFWLLIPLTGIQKVFLIQLQKSKNITPIFSFQVVMWLLHPAQKP